MSTKASTTSSTHLVEIERQIIAELVKAGCKYIQIDAPGYTAYVDKVSLERMRSRGEDPERNFQRSIDADNAIIEGFPGVSFRHSHLPRQRPHHRSQHRQARPPMASRRQLRRHRRETFQQLKHQRCCWNTTATAPAASNRCA